MALQIPTSGDDLIDARGEAAGVYIDGGAGNDTIFGSAFVDVLIGGDGVDTIDAGDGDDRIIASAVDTVTGGAGRDVLVTADDTPWDININLRGIEVMIAGNGNDNIVSYGSTAPVEIVAGGGNDFIGVGGGFSTVFGQTGDDTIYLDGCDFFVDGGDGNDSLGLNRISGRTIDMAETHFEAVIISAGSGNIIDGSSQTTSLIIQAGYDNTAIGGDFSDQLSSMGSSLLNGGGGDDFLRGQAGDRLFGGDGNDTMYANMGVASIDGGNGTSDVLLYAGWTGDPGRTFDLAAMGIEILEIKGVGNYFIDAGGQATSVTVDSGEGSDIITASAFGDRLSGGNGNDFLFGGTGVDFLGGGYGDDVLIGGNGADWLDGGAGNDTIVGDSLDRLIEGWSGHDLLYALNDDAWNIDLGVSHIEWMSAGGNGDTIDATSQDVAVEVYGNGGGDHITGSALGDRLWGGDGDDILTGGAGDDLLVGGFGFDQIFAGEGNDVLLIDRDDRFGNLDAGAGADLLYIVPGAERTIASPFGPFSMAGVNIDMAGAHLEWLADLAGYNDVIYAPRGIANLTVYAGGGDDIVRGGAGNDYLWGQSDADFLDGGAGGDVMVGGFGGDQLTGGDGIDFLYGGIGDGIADFTTDTFYLSVGHGLDYVMDFASSRDTLNVQSLHTMFAALTITNVGGQQQIAFNGEMFAVVLGDFGLTNTLTAADFQF